MHKNPFSIFFLFLFLSGCALLPHEPQIQATDYRNEIEFLISQQEYDLAMDKTSRALKEYPKEGFFHLRKGELSEVFGKTRTARRIYRKAFKKLPPGNPWLPEIAYRLGLLEALSRNEPEEATKQLEKLPQNSAAYIDLRAAIAIAQNDPREGLSILNEAIGKGIAKGDAARMLLHAAMAYDMLGENEKTLESLYKAINVGGKTLVVSQIEKYWNKVKKEHPQNASH